MKKITPRILRISKFELDFWIFWAKKGFLPFSFSSSKIFIGFEEFWIFPWKIRGIWIFHRWTFCSQSEKKRYDLRNFGFFGEFYFDHGKFYVSESRNFGFFGFNILLSAKKIVKGFKEFWIFPQSFYHSREIYCLRIKEIWNFSHNSFLLSKKLSIGFKEFWNFLCKLSSLEI